MKTKVVPDLCISCGVCTELVPEIFFMNDSNIAEAKPGDVPENLENEVRGAAEDCPSNAIIVE